MKWSNTHLTLPYLKISDFEGYYGPLAPSHPRAQVEGVTTWSSPGKGTRGGKEAYLLAERIGRMNHSSSGTWYIEVAQ